jgi:hypothetical protein
LLCCEMVLPSLVVKRETPAGAARVVATRAARTRWKASILAAMG